MYLHTNLQYLGSETVGFKSTQILLDFIGGKWQDKITIWALKQLDSKVLKFFWILLVGSGKIKSRLCVKKFSLIVLTWIFRDD